jgi:hypothetical protein
MAGWTCYSGSNNIHFNYPPIISDGRLFTSYQPESVINERIQNSANINSNWNYRRYLQQNGLQIMNYNNKEACSMLGLENNNEVSTPSSNVPYKFNSLFDTSQPCQKSDLKSPYMTREQLNTRLISPTINPIHFQDK